MSLANPQQFPINNSQYPAMEQGPRGVKIALTGSATGFTISDDLTIENENGTINNVQSVYIDNSHNASSFTLTMLESGQVILVPANTQGYYPVYCHQQVSYTATYTSIGSGGGSTTVNLIFYNTPCDPMAWSTLPTTCVANIQSSVVAAALTNTITPSSNRRVYVTGLLFSGNGATAASSITATVSGIAGVNIGIDIFVPVIGTGVTLSQINFTEPLCSNSLGGAVVVSTPSHGAGNTHASTTVFLYTA